MSIYSELMQTAAENGGGLPKDKPATLADHNDIEPRYRDLWVAGAFEAELLRTPYDVRAKAFQNYKMAAAVKKQIKKPCEKNYAAMEKALSKYYAISIADPVLSFISREDKALMRREALHIIKESNKREIVKFGIVMLGHSGIPEDVELLKFIGSHDEFTLYAAAALTNIVSESEKDDCMVALAKSTAAGWGKVAAILEIDDNPSENVQNWLLKDGSYCYIGKEHIACECAIKGGMVEKIKQLAESDDGNKMAFLDEYYDGICNILEGLIVADRSNKGLDGLSEVNEIKWAIDTLRGIVSDVNYSDTSRINAVFADIDRIFA